MDRLQSCVDAQFLNAADENFINKRISGKKGRRPAFVRTLTDASIVRHAGNRQPLEVDARGHLPLLISEGGAAWDEPHLFRLPLFSGDERIAPASAPA